MRRNIWKKAIVLTVLLFSCGRATAQAECVKRFGDDNYDHIFQCITTISTTIVNKIGFNDSLVRDLAQWKKIKPYYRTGKTLKFTGMHCVAASSEFLAKASASSEALRRAVEKFEQDSAERLRGFSRDLKYTDYSDSTYTKCTDLKTGLSDVRGHVPQEILDEWTEHAMIKRGPSARRKIGNNNHGVYMCKQKSEGGEYCKESNKTRGELERYGFDCSSNGNRIECY